MGAFSGCWEMKECTIPSGVVSIGNGAFSACMNLETVTIPASVTNIGYDLFMYCDKFIAIIGDAGSSAETYADDFGYTFMAR
jgi:hypothetical protein